MTSRQEVVVTISNFMTTEVFNHECQEQNVTQSYNPVPPGLLFGIVLPVLLPLFLLLMVIISQPVMRCAPRYILFANLIIAECLDALLASLSTALLVMNKVPTASGVVCVIAQTGGIGLHSGAIAGLAAISLDRYIAIRRPLQYEVLCSPRHVVIGLVLLWTLVGTVAIMVAIIGAFTAEHPLEPCEMLVLMSHAILLNIYWVVFTCICGLAITVCLRGVWLEGHASGAFRGRSSFRAITTILINALHLGIYILPTPVHNAMLLMARHEEGGKELEHKGENSNCGSATQENEDGVELLKHIIILGMSHIAQALSLVFSGFRKKDVHAVLFKVCSRWWSLLHLSHGVSAIGKNMICISKGEVR